jgi:hypothetical protein
VNRTLFYTFLAFYTSAIVYLASTIPIGSHEATVYYTDSGVLYYLTHFFEDYFDNSLAFRLPFVLFGLLNIPLFFIMSRLYFDRIEESYLATTIYLLLPGIITSTILVNISALVITFVLFFIIFYEKKYIWGEAFSVSMLLLLHDASIIFFVALSIFFAFRKKTNRFVVSLILSAISLLYFNDLNIGGKPTGEFLQLFGLYMALFSPLVFFYFFYALYRMWLREKKDILWYISFTAFVFSILLSLRQQVDMTDFAPYVIVSVVLMLVTYHKTLYVRLPLFQKSYRLGFNIVFGSLMVSALIILLHPLFFYFIDDKTKHFAYPFYEPYWQVSELHEIGQNCYTVKNRKVQYQLKYYGIETCKESNVPKIHR